MPAVKVREGLSVKKQMGVWVTHDKGRGIRLKLRLGLAGIITASILGVSVDGIQQKVAAASTSTSLMSAVTQHIIQQDTHFALQAGMNEATAGLRTVMAQQRYYSSLVNHIYYTSDGSTTWITISWRQSRQQSIALDAKIKQVEGQIVKAGMSDYDKEFVIHNWIVLHAAYDQSLRNYTPYDTMFHGTSVCEGYALLTYRMLSMAGIKNYLVEGYVGGQSHLWNKVSIGNHIYNLDTTFDDPVPNQPGVVHYEYYNETDQQFLRDHQWNQSGLPIANTDFEQTIKNLLPKTNDKMLLQIANRTGIEQDLNSTVVTSQTLQQALEKAITNKEKSVSFKFQGTLEDAQTAVNALSMLGLVGFTSMNSQTVPSRDSGYVMITFTITY